MNNKLVLQIVRLLNDIPVDEAQRILARVQTLILKTSVVNSSRAEAEVEIGLRRGQP